MKFVFPPERGVMDPVSLPKGVFQEECGPFCKDESGLG